MSDTQHEHTIGTVIHDGQVYEIDWPFDPYDDTERDQTLAVIFHDGEEVAGVEPLPGQQFATKAQVMEAATTVVENGGI